MHRLLIETAARCPGGILPDNYIVFDSETTGTDPFSARVVQYGLCIVRARKPCAPVVQIVRHEGLQIPKQASDIHGITTERMLAEGTDSKEFLAEILQTLKMYEDAGYVLVGHNAVAFDAPLFEMEARRHNLDFRFHENSVIDTGALVKASQLRMYYEPSDTLRNFARRVAEVRAKGVFWSLDRYCYHMYKLERSGVSKEQAHDAGSDCLLTHFLFECLRELSQKEAAA
jgi:DNA polymerase III epsilon subunit-like protein